MIKNIQMQIDQTDYWDAKILDFQINYFGDEVNVLIYNDQQTSWKISFKLCYKVKYETDANWKTSDGKNWRMRDVKNMTAAQLGYYGQDIIISEETENKGFYSVKLDLTLLIAEIVCKEIIVEKILNNSLDLFWK